MIRCRQALLAAAGAAFAALAGCELGFALAPPEAAAALGTLFRLCAGALLLDLAALLGLHLVKLRCGSCGAVFSPGRAMQRRRCPRCAQPIDRRR